MNEVVKHTILDSDIHHFVWLTNTSESVHVYIREFNRILRQAIQNKPATLVTLRFLLDFRQTNLPPFADVVAETVDSRRRSSVDTDKVTCRFAYISNDNNIAELLTRIGSLTPPQYQRSFFKADEEEQAINWLHADDDN